MNRDYTEKLILKICNQPRSLDYITQRLNGVDPVTALNFLKELEQKNLIRVQDDLWLIEDKARQEILDILNPSPQVYLKKYMGDFDFFKKPHPLDFEWRNTKKSVNYLADLVLESNQKDDDILILGMPTLFANLCKKDILQKVTIVERNKGVINTLKEFSNNTCKVIEADIFKIEQEEIGMYSTVVMDPPWYEPHFHQFIWVANRCLKLGGRLIISIPPLNTRPGIDAERIRWFELSQKNGLGLESLLAKKLEYSMPFFEWNATRIAGAMTSPHWRKGDIAIFQKLNVIYEERPKFTEDIGNWKEIEVDNCRIRVMIEAEDDQVNDIEIIPLVPTQILASVSSREPIRKQANVWTSGNRIFRTNKPLRLYSCLQYYKDQIVEKSNESQKIFDFIELISRLENEEHNSYIEWFYHEMEREIN